MSISSETRNLWIGNLQPHTQYNFKLVSAAVCDEVVMGEQTLLILPYCELVRYYLVFLKYLSFRLP